MRHEKPPGTSQKSILLKFMFPKKATKIDEIFTANLLLTA